MQEPLFPTDITRKLYTERAILIGTFIGGPLAGGYLLARNFSAMEKGGRAGITWVVTITVLLLTLATAFIPALESVPPVVFSFIFCIAAHTVAKKLQGADIHLHKEHGGIIQPTWRAVVAGILFMLLMVAVFLGAFYLADQTVSE